MAVRKAMFFGVLCRKGTPARDAYIKMIKESDEEMVKQGIPSDLSEDDKAITWSCGMNSFDLHMAVEGMVEKGLVPNEDFLVTSGISNGKTAVPWARAKDGEFYVDSDLPDEFFGIKKPSVLSKFVKRVLG